MRGLLHLPALIVCFGLPGHAPAQEAARPLQRIAFGSCAQQERPQPIWEAVLQTKPDLFLFVGDNIYGDTEDMAVLRAKYGKLAAMPGYAKLREACPILATWDDHDFGVNDGGRDYPKRVESQQEFLDFFSVPKDSPRRKREGVYHAEMFGPLEERVQVILLDTRYHRSPLKKNKGKPSNGPYVVSDDPDATVLGEDQWKWLEGELRKPARVRLIASSIQVVPEDHGWEKWMNMPRERERLFKLIRDTKAGGVIFLSGDRHLAELSQMDGGVGYPLYDLTSSGLNQGNKKWRPQEKNRHRVATMNYGNNFGLIEIDWERKDPLLRLQIRDEAGDIIIQQKVALSVLQPGTLAVGSARPKLSSDEELTPERIKEHTGQKVTLTLRVRTTGEAAKSKLIFLNSADNRLNDDNFTIVIDTKAQAKFREAGVAAIREHYEGKTLRVTGTLSLFRGQPQIIVSDPAQVEIVEKKE
jgi:alkaline phosphatase D